MNEQKCKCGCPEMGEVKLYSGETLDKAIKRIDNKSVDWNCKTFGRFNGHNIYSFETIEQIYTKVTGKTKDNDDVWMN